MMILIAVAATSRYNGLNFAGGDYSDDFGYSKRRASIPGIKNLGKVGIVYWWKGSWNQLSNISVE